MRNKIGLLALATTLNACATADDPLASDWEKNNRLEAAQRRFSQGYLPPLNKEQAEQEKGMQRTTGAVGWANW